MRWSSKSWLGAKNSMNTTDRENVKTFPILGATRRFARGGIANFLGEVFRALEHIILVPLFLWAWSDVIYGEWLIVFSVVGYLSFADVGMTNFVINRMLQRYAVGDQAGYRKTFWSAWHLYGRIILILLPLFVGFAFAAPFPEWFKFRDVSETSIRIAVFMLGLYLLLGRMVGLFSGVYISSGRYSRWRTLLIFRDVFTAAAVGIALLLGQGFIAVAGSYLVFAIIFFGFVYFDIKRQQPEIGFHKSAEYTDKKIARSFFIPGLVFLLIPLGHFIKIQGSVLLAGSLFSGALVALFGIHRMLANLIPRFVEIFLPALQHEVTAAYERRDMRKVQDAHNLLIKVVLATSVSVAVFLFAAGKDILAIWTSDKIEFHSFLWMLLLIDVVVYSVWSASSRFQIAANRYKWYAVIHVLSAGLGWLLAALLVNQFGVAGIAAGFLIPGILINFTLIPYLTLKMAQVTLMRFFSAVGLGLILAVLQVLISDVIIRLPVYHPVQIALTGLTVVVIGSLFTLGFWFQRHERELFYAVCKVPVGRVRRLLKGYDTA